MNIEIDDQSTPLNSYFDENGFSTKSALKNLGSTTIYLGILCLLLLQIPLLSICKSKSRCIEYIHSKLSENLLWSGTLKFIFA
jgi:hypothetical protein